MSPPWGNDLVEQTELVSGARLDETRAKMGCSK